MKIKSQKDFWAGLMFVVTGLGPTKGIALPLLSSGGTGWILTAASLGLLIANGFSGHGLQQAPATGRGLAELVVDGRYTSLDLSPLGYERIIEGRPMIEKNIV